MTLYERYMADKKAGTLGIMPKWNKKGNVKLGNAMWSFSTLYGNIEHHVDKLGIDVKGTCGKYCNGCMSECYVKSSYRYGSVIYGHARNTIAIRNSMENSFFELNAYIERAKNKPSIIRYDQSGEIESIEQLHMFASLAWIHSDIKFYIYTKAYDIIIPALLNGEIPSNMVVNISIWHEYGIKEYLKVAHLENVKAFVCVDDDWTIEEYAKHGIIITTMCKAYDENGHLDHNVTCEKCGKCFEIRKNAKVIGCYKH